MARTRAIVKWVVVDMVAVFWEETRGTRDRETAVYMSNLWNPCLFFLLPSLFIRWVVEV